MHFRSCLSPVSGLSRGSMLALRMNHFWGIASRPLAGELMPQRMDIRMIKDILRLKYQCDMSHERIARSLSISKGAVSKYLSLAGAAGLTWTTVAELDEAALERRLLGRSAADE